MINKKKYVGIDTGLNCHCSFYATVHMMIIQVNSTLSDFYGVIISSVI